MTRQNVLTRGISKAIKLFVGLSATNTMRTFDKYIFPFAFAIPPGALNINSMKQQLAYAMTHKLSRTIFDDMKRAFMSFVTLSHPQKVTIFLHQSLFHYSLFYTVLSHSDNLIQLPISCRQCLMLLASFTSQLSQFDKTSNFMQICAYVATRQVINLQINKKYVNFCMNFHYAVGDHRINF